MNRVNVRTGTATVIIETDRINARSHVVESKPEKNDVSEVKCGLIEIRIKPTVFYSKF